MKEQRAQTWVPFGAIPPLGAQLDSVSCLPSLKAPITELSCEQLLDVALVVVAELQSRAGKPSVESEGMLALGVIAQKTLRELNTISKGDSSAVVVLLSVLRDAVNALNFNAKSNPETYDDTIKQTPTWPINFSPNKSLATDTRDLEKIMGHPDLRLKGTGDKGRKRSFTFTEGEKKLALDAYRCLEANRETRMKINKGDKIETDVPAWVKHCRGLPSFSACTVDTWADVAWESILNLHGGHPENDPELRKIGLRRAGKATEGSKSEQSHIRNGIREKLLENLRELANDKHPPL